VKKKLHPLKANTFNENSLKKLHPLKKSPEKKITFPQKITSPQKITMKTDIMGTCPNFQLSLTRTLFL
jgi:hypothetical protein